MNLFAIVASLVFFAGGAWSTGWISYEDQDGRIFVPAKINGHPTSVLIATGLPVSDIDKSYAASIGLRPNGLVRGLNIQIGNLTLRDTRASVVDFTKLTKHIEHSLPFLLGDDLFNRFAVDIDFAHHRIAFSDPSHVSKPQIAFELPLTRIEDIPLVPASIEGAPPAEFELGIGNSAETLIYPSYYNAHKLLAGRRLSKRLAAGSAGIDPEPIGTVRSAGFAGFMFTDMPAAFLPANLTGTKSTIISGDLGLPLLARFRLIVDYSHNRLYAVPYANKLHAPFPKDRLGLFLIKEGAGFAVAFVSPGSPAQTAGFRVGDKIALINGKAQEAWPGSSFADLRYGPRGSSLVFTMQSGSVRRVRLTDFF